MSGLPDSSSGVHVGAPFLRCYREVWVAVGGTRSGCPASGEQTSIRSLEGKVDVGFMWTYGHYSPAQLGVGVNLGASLKIDRFPGFAATSPRWPDAPVMLSEWQQSHPTWIEYTCAVDAQGRHTTPAWEFGDLPTHDDAYVPFNINDPQARQYFFDTYVKPSLDNGYRIVLFDNVHVRRNSWDRCGHYDAQGQWQQDYAGASAPYDPRWQADMLSWLQYLRDSIHAYAPGAKLAINYNPAQAKDPPALYRQVFGIVDLVWEEGGFTDWGVERLSTAGLWNQEFQAMSYLAAQPGKAVLINGIAGGHESRTAGEIRPDDRQWVIGNYLLVKGAHSYTAALPNAYGSSIDFPEYHIPIGAPESSAYQSQSVWMRDFTGGIAIVNPDTRSHTITVPTGYTSVEGQGVHGAIVLRPTSALILLGHNASSAWASVSSARRPSRLARATASQVSLAGVAIRAPKLAFTLSVSADASPIRAVAVRLTRDLSLAGSPRLLARGIAVTGTGGRHLRFTATVVHGALTIRLRVEARKVRITLTRPGLSVTTALASRVRHGHTGRLRLRARVTDARHTVTLVQLPVQPTR